MLNLENDAYRLLPNCRLGFINPLDVIDTLPYTFYRIAPDNAVGSWISLGLQGFSHDSATAAVAPTNLDRCLRELVKREVDFITLGGLPLLFNLDRQFSQEFTQRCHDEFGVHAATTLDASLAAFRALDAKNVVVVNKWDERLNRLLAALLEAEGINLIGAVTEVYTATEVQSSFEDGVDIGLRLAERAMVEYPNADCIFFAGGAWLIAPFIRQIEDKFGVSVVAGQLSNVWYTLNMVGNGVNRPEYGRLLTTEMVGA